MTTPPAPPAIPRELLAAVVRHARDAFPAECCGYLTGSSAPWAPREPAPCHAAVRCRNAQPDGLHPTHPERSAGAGFVIAGGELLAFARTFQGPSPARVVYHSHPDGRAYFSDVDRDNARAAGYPVQHLVIGMGPTGATEAALFADAGDGDFAEVFRWSAAMLG